MRTLLALTVAFATLLHPAALRGQSDGEQLRPDGWTERVVGQALVYESPDGGSRITLRIHPGTDLAGIALEVLAPDRPSGSSPRGDSNQRDGEAIGRGYMRTDLDPWTMAQVFVFPHAGGGAVSMYSQYEVRSLRSVQAHQEVFKELGVLAEAGRPLPTVQQATEEAELPETGDRAPAPDPVVEAEPVPTPAAGEGLPVEWVVFDLDYLYGLGGVATPEYEPVYLLADGRACQCPTYAPDAVTESVLRAVDPGRKGRWQQRASGFVITYEDGSDPEEVDGELSRPTPIEDPSRLDGRYQAIGGGGNVALGGSVMAAEVEDLTFFGDGSFQQSNFSFGTTSFSTAWRKRGSSGTWTLNGGTLTLEYRDGTRVRTSVFYSAKRGERDGSDPYGVLWIGGESFTKR